MAGKAPGMYRQPKPKIGNIDEQVASVKAKPRDPYPVMHAVQGMFSGADAAPKKNPDILPTVNTRARGGAPSYGKAATIKKSGSNTGMSDADRMAALGASSGSITRPDKAAQAANKARGDAYLANNTSTDYGLGSSVNDFVKKKK